MRAIMVSRPGGPEVLELTDVPAPEPGPGQLLVGVAAAGVNFMDIYQREGRPQYARPVPFTPGAEGAGTVLAAGSDVVASRPATGSPGPGCRAVTPSRWRSRPDPR